MGLVFRWLTLVVAIFASVSCGHANRPKGVVCTPCVSIESGDVGYDKGVSAMFAGVAGGELIVAGGANFPDVPAADGGRKAFYDYIYRYVDDDCRSGWQRIGTLPAAAAYGVSYSTSQGVVFAGGTGCDGAMRSVYMVETEGDKSIVRKLAELPCAIEQAAGAAIGSMLYLFGGVADGEPSSALFVLDLDDEDPQWCRLTPAPEPFVQPVAAASDGRLYVWGGFNPATKQVSSSGYCYDTERDEWFSVPGHPEGGTFTGASAVTLPDGRILCIGGVDRKIFSAALQLPAGQMREYLLQPAEDYRFQHTLHIFDPATAQWIPAGDCDSAARAGAALVVFRGRVCQLGGELKPGIRTTDNCWYDL